MWQDVLRAVLYGMLEGVTEWLPISSTGHLILLERVLSLSVSAEFFALFEVVIQLGAMLAVPVIFWGRLWPFGKDPQARHEVLALWGQIAIATLPSVAAGLLLDDILTAYLFRPAVVAAMLIAYGVAFLFLEKGRKYDPLGGQFVQITPKIALLVGCFQTLALVPGTSRSGATILGGMLLGLARPVAAEFSFFLGIPTMFGAGVLKCVKFFGAGQMPTGREMLLLLVATAVAFLTSLGVIRFLMDFVRRHSFAAFGVYRILLGGAVLAAMLFGLI